MKPDSVGLFAEDMPRMIRCYRDALGYEIKEDEDAGNGYLVKDGTLLSVVRAEGF